MTFEARFSREFLSKFKRLPRDVKDRVTLSVKGLLQEPQSGVPLHGILKGKYKRRVGRYRIVYGISASERVVIFYDVDLRKRVYK